MGRSSTSENTWLIHNYFGFCGIFEIVFSAVDRLDNMKRGLNQSIRQSFIPNLLWDLGKCRQVFVCAYVQWRCNVEVRTFVV